MSSAEAASLFARDEREREWYQETYAAKAAFHKAVSAPGGDVYEYWMSRLFKHLSAAAQAAQEVRTFNG